MSNNPLAFPVAAFGPADDMIAEPGMTLRDYFAGQALAGLMATGQHDGGHDAAPGYAYFLADAMLAERAKASS